MSHVGAFARNVLSAAGIRVIGLVAGLGFSVMVARLLGPEGKGLYSLAVLFPALILTFANLGIGRATAYLAAKGEHSRQSILGNSVWLSLVTGAVSSALGFVIVVFFGEKLLVEVPRTYLFLALALVPPSLLTGNLLQILFGLERFKDVRRVSMAQAVVILPLTGGVLWGLHAGVPGVIIIRVLTSLIFAIGIFFLVRRILGGVSWRPNRPYMKAAATFGAQSHLDSILQFLIYRLDMFLINGFLNPAAVGFYTIAVGAAERIWLVSDAVGMALYPRVAAETDEDTRKALTPILSRNVLWVNALGAAVLCGLSHWIVVVLYSTTFLAAVRPLQILLIGVVALSVSRILANDLAGRGRPILNSCVSAGGLAINIGLNLVLIPKYGIEGAAAATTVSYVAMCGFTVAVYSALSGNSVWQTIVPQFSDWELWKKAPGFLLRRVTKKANTTKEAAIS